MSNEDMDLDQIKSRKLFCNVCQNFTNHQREYGPKTRPSSDGFGTTIVYDYDLWSCIGCETLTLEITTSIQVVGEDQTEDFPDTYYFPVRKVMYPGRKRYENIPVQIYNVYSETVAALNGDLALLCLVGIGALLDGICNDKKVSGEKLHDKIDGLKVLLPDNLVNKLQIFDSLRNIAAHQMQPVDVFIMPKAISVLEGILDFFYKMEEETQEIKGMNLKSKSYPLTLLDYDHEKNSYWDIM